MTEDFSEFDVQEPERSSLSDPPASLTALKAVLTRRDEDEPHDGIYKGFPIVPRSQIPSSLPAQHASLTDRFYVTSPLGAVGLVPWVGSKIIWPWEQGWVQDMHRPQVQSILKDVKERKK